MSFTASNGKILIKFRPENLSGMECVSGYLLSFQMQYTVPRWEDESEVFVRNIRTRIFVNEKLLGWATPETLSTYKPYKKHDVTGTFCFELFVTSQTIEAIEKIRQGGGLKFKLEIKGECRDKDNYSMQCQQDVLLDINQKAWIDLLKQIKYSEHLLFEMPVSLNPTEQETEVFTAVRKANEQLQYGHYDEVVLNCRKALEAILKDTEQKALRKKYADHKKEMSKQERLSNVYGALYHLSHLSAHIVEEDNHAHFSREEARMILGTTYAAISQHFKS